LLIIGIKVKAEEKAGYDSLSLNLEYQIWQSDNDSVRSPLLYAKAELANQYNLTQEYRSALRRLPSQEKDKPEVRYAIAKSCFFDSLYYDAFVELTSIEDSILISNFNMLSLWLFTNLENEHYDYLQKLLGELYAQKKLTYEAIEPAPKLNPEVALKRSKYLPGLGMFYCKKYFRGAVSLTLNLTFLGFGYHQFATNYYTSGLVFGVYPFMRFYNGGKVHSYELALNYNKQLDEAFIAKLRERIFYYLSL